MAKNPLKAYFKKLKKEFPPGMSVYDYIVKLGEQTRQWNIKGIYEDGYQRLLEIEEERLAEAMRCFYFSSRIVKNPPDFIKGPKMDGSDYHLNIGKHIPFKFKPMKKEKKPNMISQIHVHDGDVISVEHPVEWEVKNEGNGLFKVGPKSKVIKCNHEYAIISDGSRSVMYKCLICGHEKPVEKDLDWWWDEYLTMSVGTLAYKERICGRKEAFYPIMDKISDYSWYALMDFYRWLADQLNGNDLLGQWEYIWYHTNQNKFDVGGSYCVSFLAPIRHKVGTPQQIIDILGEEILKKIYQIK